MLALNLSPLGRFVKRGRSKVAKGFLISIKNDLLEAKHVESMGASVWLYMYFLDKMTSVSEKGVGKVLGGKPITYIQINLDLGITERTYQRWVTMLRSAGYINTKRTPYGLVFSVNKAHKTFGNRSAKNGGTDRVKPTKTDPPKMAGLEHRDPPKMAGKIRQKGGSNKTVTVDNTSISLTTNTAQAPIDDRRNRDVQKVVEHFEKRVGEMPRAVHQRRAAHTLIQRHGFEKTIGAINAVVLSRGERYAPTIASLTQLRDRWIELENFYRRNTKPRGTKIR